MKLAGSTYAAGIFVVLILVAGLLSGIAYAANGQGNCFGVNVQDVKVEGAGPHVVNAPAGNVFKEAYIKTGQAGCILYTADTNDGCYSVSGIGTSTLSISRVGPDSPQCQEISHIEAIWGPPSDGNGQVGNGEEPGNGTTGGEETPPVTPPVTEVAPPATTETPAAVAGVTSLPSTGLAIAVPLAGAGLFAAGYVLRRRNS
jgi:hypothetical protein